MLQVTYFVLWLAFMLAVIAGYLSAEVPPETSLALSLLGLALVYGLALWSVFTDKGEFHRSRTTN